MSDSQTATIESAAGENPLSTAGSELNRSRLGHLPALDGVRGLAIAMVMVYHFAPPPTGLTANGHGLRALSELGSYGVDLFFVLSGFLITGILLRAKATPHYYRNFYARRVLRIFPLYYSVLIAITLLAFLIPAWRNDPGMHRLLAAWPWYWFYATNYLVIRSGWTVVNGAPVGVGHFWSLAIEEHFYAIWPWLVHRLSARSMMAACCATMVLCLGFRGLSLVMGQSYFMSKFASQCRFDSLAIGALVALVSSHYSIATARRLFRWVGAAAAVLVGLVFLHDRTIDLTAKAGCLFGSPLIALVFAAVVVESISAGWMRIFFSFTPLRVLGVYSYGLYVYHALAGGYINRFASVEVLYQHLPGGIGAAPLAHYAICFIIPFCVAVISFHCLESPFLKLKRFFE